MMSLCSRRPGWRMAAATSRRSLVNVAATTAAASPPPPPVAVSSDRSVETMNALKKLLLHTASSHHHHHHHYTSSSNKNGSSKASASVTEESLTRALNYFTAHLENARLCLVDTNEAADGEYEQEYQTASQALQAAVQAYVDLLELLGGVSDATIRETWEAKRTTIFEQLQAQLTDMKACVRHRNSKATTTTTGP